MFANKCTRHATPSNPIRDCLAERADTEVYLALDVAGAGASMANLIRAEIWDDVQATAVTITAGDK